MAANDGIQTGGGIAPIPPCEAHIKQKGNLEPNPNYPITNLLNYQFPKRFFFAQAPIRSSALSRFSIELAMLKRR